MVAKLIDGEAIAAKIMSDVRRDVEFLKSRGRTTKLVSILVGDDPGSKVYVKKQAKSSEETGIQYDLRSLPETTTQGELLKLIDSLNHDASVNGIILQVPLPKHLNERQAQAAIAPEKDPEGIHPVNLGMLVYEEARVAPCTALAALECLKSLEINLKGLEVVIVGRSEIVGKPLALLLLQKPWPSATPTICHTGTKDLSFHTSRADVVVAAAGRAEFIKGSMLKRGSIVVDVGINVVDELDATGKPVLNEKGKPKKKIVGDVEFEVAKEVCSYITPVPGGVGPIATAMLFRNTMQCAKIQSGLGA